MNRRAFLLNAPACVAVAGAVAIGAGPSVDLSSVERIASDVRIARTLDVLRDASPHGALIINNVHIVDPLTATATGDRSILIIGDDIAWVGRGGEAAPTRGAVSIDGTGLYAAPGLTDMHVHTQGMGEHLLRLAAGVTTVREMAGFPWLLRARDSIAGRRMIGASTYVAGTIIADYPLYGYAAVVDTAEAARQIVRNEAACGYSFIKVHNRLAQPLFDAVADEATRLGLDLIGHVPHDITIAHAVRRGRMRTLEHLKGFLIDQTLLPSAEDFREALGDAEVWITPTLYTRRQYVRGEEAARLRSDPRLRWAPRADREAWLRDEPAAGSERAQLGERFVSTQRIVMERLAPLAPRWLAGTDAAGYAYNLAGFAIHDEMALMHDAGVSIADTLRAATTQAASAMRQSHRFGRIDVNMRADIVLLSGNPLENIDAYRAPTGVVARGQWFTRERLATALDALATIYAEPALASFSSAQARRLAEDVQACEQRGVPLESMQLRAAARALLALGYRTPARVIEVAARAGWTGACAIETPS